MGMKPLTLFSFLPLVSCPGFQLVLPESTDYDSPL